MLQTPENHAPNPITDPTVPTPATGVFQRRVVGPIVELLRVGASPRRLAWSLAVGICIGVNPLLGSTTLVCLAVAWVFRLNLVASQITNHLVYPLELALFFLFVRLGERLFHTPDLPLDRAALLDSVRHHPWQTTQLLWTWEWHALIVWALCTLAAAPLLALLLTQPLNRLLHTLHTPTKIS